MFEEDLPTTLHLNLVLCHNGVRGESLTYIVGLLSMHVSIIFSFIELSYGTGVTRVYVE